MIGTAMIVTNILMTKRASFPFSLTAMVPNTLLLLITHIPNHTHVSYGPSRERREEWKK